MFADFEIAVPSYTNGDAFRPRNLREFNCTLDRMLDDATRAALAAGAEDYAKAASELLPDERLDELYAAIDRRLAALYSDDGPDTLAFAILIQDLVRFETLHDLAPAAPLQREAVALGLYTTNAVGRWLLFSYLAHLTRRRFDPDPFISYLQSRDATFAPPVTLSVSKCTERLTHEWQWQSRPYETFADIGHDDGFHNVHWGICRPTGALWAYYHGLGWTPAKTTEWQPVCNRFADEPVFLELCRNIAE